MKANLAGFFKRESIIFLIIVMLAPILAIHAKQQGDPRKDNPRRNIIFPEVETLLNDVSIPANELLELVIALKPPYEDPTVETWEESGLEVDEQGNATLTYNGARIDDLDMTNLIAEKHARISVKQEARIAARQARWETISDRSGGALKGLVDAAVANGDSSVKVSLRKHQIHGLVAKYGDLIDGIERYHEPIPFTLGEPGTPIDEVREWTRVENKAFTPGYKGEGVGIWVREASCPTNEELGFDQWSYAKSIDDNRKTTEHAMNVISILGSVAPEADIICGHPGYYPVQSALDGTLFADIDPVYIESHSTATMTHDATYTIQSRGQSLQVFDKSLSVFLAAANAGRKLGGPISDQGKGFNVITVGNAARACGDSGGPNQIACWVRARSSSWGNPETGAMKPEIMAPGYKILAGGYTKTGTSMAAPHAAAFAADMMAQAPYYRLKPAALKAAIMASARDEVNEGEPVYEAGEVVNGKPESILVDTDTVGVGGINYKNFRRSKKNKHWIADNNDFFDGSDKYEYVYHINAGKDVRAVLVWLNDPNYTYVTKEIGMEIDLDVYGPHGNWVSSSQNDRTGFQMVEFETTLAGDYTFIMRRRSNNDPNLRIEMSLHIERSRSK